MSITFHAGIDAQGALLGFYRSDINTVIPPGAVEITEAQHAEWFANQATRRWVNGGLTTVAAPAVPVFVPQTVTMVQATLALHALPGAEDGKTLLDDVEAAVAAASDARVKLAWARATTLDRTGLFVMQLAGDLGLSDDKLDALFIAAAGIST